MRVWPTKQMPPSAVVLQCLEVENRSGPKYLTLSLQLTDQESEAALWFADIQHHSRPKPYACWAVRFVSQNGHVLCSTAHSGVDICLPDDLTEGN